MAGIPKNECDIDAGQVESAKQAYDDLFSNISGRSGEYNLITEPVSFDFSGLVADNLRAAANENQYAWRSSMSACALAFGVLSEVYEAVVEYDEKLEDIRDRYNAYVTSLGDTFSPESKSVMISFQTEADGALTVLTNRCNSAEEILDAGATAESIRALAEAGHFGQHGQIGYYIHEDLNYFHVDETQAETIAIHLRNGVLEGHAGSIEALEDNPELLALITNVALRAGTAERNGEKLSDGEIAFLETIHEELQIGEDGFLDFLKQIESSEHISDSLREEINRSLANGTLALSNEAVGGGMDLLPEDVQRTALGRPDLDIDDLASGGDPQDYVDDYNAWSSDFITLADYFSSSSPGINGGTEFSTTLLATTANDVQFADFYPNGPDDSDFQKILDVAARNPEANNIMLTGEDFDGDKYDHHEKHEGMTPEYFLEAIYTRDWPDDGQAASKVTDWISRSSENEHGVQEEQRAKALVALTDILSDEDFQEKVFSTGESVEGKDGNGEDFTWENVSAGHLNSHIAESFSKIFYKYEDAFAHTDEIESEDYESGWNSDHERPDLSPAGRMAFTQLMLGDENVAAEVYEHVLLNTVNEMEFYASNEGDREDRRIVMSGSLQGLVDEALRRESDGRVETHNDYASYMDKVNGSAVDIVGGVASDLRVPSTFVEMAKSIAKDGLETPGAEELKNPTASAPIHITTLVEFAISNHAEKNPEWTEMVSENENWDGIVVGEGGDLSIPMSHDDWNNEHNDGALIELYGDIKNEPWPNGDQTTWEAITFYMDTFNGHSSSWLNV